MKGLKDIEDSEFFNCKLNFNDVIKFNNYGESLMLDIKVWSVALNES